MPHQRKYVPSHSGEIASQPSRAKRWMSAYASQGLSSRLSRSTRCAFVSFTASLIGAPQKCGAGRGSRSAPSSRLVSSASTSPCDGVTSPDVSQAYLDQGFTSHGLGRLAPRGKAEPRDCADDHEPASDTVMGSSVR